MGRGEIANDDGMAIGGVVVVQLDDAACREGGGTLFELACHLCQPAGPQDRGVVRVGQVDRVGIGGFVARGIRNDQVGHKLRPDLEIEGSGIADQQPVAIKGKGRERVAIRGKAQGFAFRQREGRQFRFAQPCRQFIRHFGASGGSGMAFGVQRIDRSTRLDGLLFHDVAHDIARARNGDGEIGDFDPGVGQFIGDGQGVAAPEAGSRLGQAAAFGQGDLDFIRIGGVHRLGEGDRQGDEVARRHIGIGDDARVGQHAGEDRRGHFGRGDVEGGGGFTGGGVARLVGDVQRQRQGAAAQFRKEIGGQGVGAVPRDVREGEAAATAGGDGQRRGGVGIKARDGEAGIGRVKDAIIGQTVEREGKIAADIGGGVDCQGRGGGDAARIAHQIGEALPDGQRDGRLDIRIRLTGQQRGPDQRVFGALGQVRESAALNREIAQGQARHRLGEGEGQKGAAVFFGECGLFCRDGNLRRGVVHIGDGDGDRLAVEEVACVMGDDGDGVDVVAIGRGGGFEIRGGFEGQRAGGAVEIEQLGIVASQLVAEVRCAAIIGDGERGDRRAVFGDRDRRRVAAPVRGDDRRIVDAFQLDGHRGGRAGLVLARRPVARSEIAVDQKVRPIAAHLREGDVVEIGQAAGGFEDDAQSEAGQIGGRGIGGKAAGGLRAFADAAGCGLQKKDVAGKDPHGDGIVAVSDGVDLIEAKGIGRPGFGHGGLVVIGADGADVPMRPFEEDNRALRGHVERCARGEGADAAVIARPGPAGNQFDRRRLVPVARFPCADCRRVAHPEGEAGRAVEIPGPEEGQIACRDIGGRNELPRRHGHAVQRKRAIGGQGGNHGAGEGICGIVGGVGELEIGGLEDIGRVFRSIHPAGDTGGRIRHGGQIEGGGLVCQRVRAIGDREGQRHGAVGMQAGRDAIAVAKIGDRAVRGGQAADGERAAFGIGIGRKEGGLGHDIGRILHPGDEGDGAGFRGGFVAVQHADSDDLFGPVSGAVGNADADGQVRVRFVIGPACIMQAVSGDVEQRVALIPFARGKRKGQVRIAVGRRKGGDLGSGSGAFLHQHGVFRRQGLGDLQRAGCRIHKGECTLTRPTGG